MFSWIRTLANNLVVFTPFSSFKSQASMFAITGVSRARELQWNLSLSVSVNVHAGGLSFSFPILISYTDCNQFRKS
ncbi:hypothetical protein K435DRAFT_282615 [Dendrothele bispora CBS 962.96]|uniref:Uncharacterized protein n=1 Tax=Dendrothele bispora (strain CBS 962.96) TaxID=1314807 RepID=A0A4S8LM38_DENBC|nr:hypothetical protein K435DRAFT_282615 [Dendrothele bispora CBS 962.96]